MLPPIAVCVCVCARISGCVCLLLCLSDSLCVSLCLSVCYDNWRMPEAIAEGCKIVLWCL